jgi:hypothetical protein
MTSKQRNTARKHRKRQNRLKVLRKEDRAALKKELAARKRKK